jgi:presenilin-like A22 family membrane protease
MLFDIVLPLVIGIVTVAIVLLYAKFEAKIKSLFEEERGFQIRDVIFLVIGMSVMVTAVVFIPQQAILILFLATYSFVLFLFTYIAVDKWYFAVLPSIAFVALYFLSWNIIMLNAFALLFAVFISIYLGCFFSWKTVLVFAALITVMDVIQVFATGFMGSAAGKFVELGLPVLIQVPTFPVESNGISLGLGDIFLGGLLAIQTTQKYDRKAGVISAVSLGFAFLVFEIIMLNYEITGYFPATLIVVGGWLLGLGLYNIIKQKLAS